MARIVGTFAPNGRDALERCARPLRGAVGGVPGEAHDLSLDRASFCWHGTGAPLAAVSDGVLVAADGRFYNLDDLGAPSDRSTAERLIWLYRRHGFAKTLARVNGDFAIALFDERSSTLWLGRDRVGHRPLYYVQTDAGFSFSSRPRPLLRVPGVSAEVNRRWVAVFAGSHYRYIDNRPDESPFAAVRQLPAATALEVSAGTPRPHRYWQLDEQPEFGEDESTLALRYRDLLIDSVRRRLRASEGPTFTLSGGMDSSSVLACAVELTGEKQQAVSSVYADRTYDESEDIKGFVAEKVARWTPIPIDEPNIFDTVGRMVRAHDEPVATATWLSHFVLCKQVAESGFGTLFGGLGGDELNAGEYEYFVFHFADIRRAGDEARLAREVAAWSSHHDHPIYRKNPEIADRLIDRLTDWSAPPRVRVDRDRLGRYASTVSRDFFDLAAFEPEHDHPFGTWLKNRTYQDIFRETAPCCLRAEDRNCGAWGLEHMDPFFDHRLMEFMFRVPGAMKIRDGVTKRLLREAMKGLLPEETRLRIKKTGWNAPAHVWFSGHGLDRILDMVHSRRFRERGVYDAAAVERLIAEHRAIVASDQPRENHMMFLWQLVNLELWFQEVVDPSSVVAA
jgi:asparagine synthase (glutamine-hydrolysing)